MSGVSPFVGFCFVLHTDDPSPSVRYTLYRYTLSVFIILITFTHDPAPPVLGR